MNKEIPIVWIDDVACVSLDEYKFCDMQDKKEREHYKDIMDELKSLTKK